METQDAFPLPTEQSFRLGMENREPGVPVVLVYLGFLEATEMITDSRQIFRSAEAWEARVRDYSKGVVLQRFGMEPYRKGHTAARSHSSREVTVNAQVVVASE